VYNADGSGKIFYAVSVGKCYLLDGLTGEQLNSLSIPDGSIEASPVVYDSRVVLGTRGQSIRGLLLK
jgi:outer membrane protein assembly factor BamB